MTQSELISDDWTSPAKAPTPACFCPAQFTRALMEEYGSPLFLLSPDKLRQNFQALRHAFAMPAITTVTTSVYYSFKTNYLPALCAVLLGEGAGAEVVSGLEYRLARKLGAGGNKIIFGGPFKTADEIRTAITDKALIIADGFDELATIANMAADMDQKARLGLRIRFGQDEQSGAPPWSRFGFSKNMGEVEKAFKIIAHDPLLDLVMLHAHEGTFCNNPQTYGQRVDDLYAMAAIARSHDLAPTMINIGGGFACDCNPAPYGAAVRAAMEENERGENKAVFGPQPTLVLEPGRALVDTAMELAASVISTKTSDNGQSLITLDAGVHLLPAALRPTPRPLIAPEKYDQATHKTAVFGPLCMPEDLLDPAALLPRLAPGDLVTVKQAGAYSISQTMSFIRARPAVVVIEATGQTLIRRREEDADFFALDLDRP